MKPLAITRCAALPIALTALALRAQPSTRIPDAPECARCAITTRTLVTLGVSDGNGAIDVGIHAVRVDSRGRYWVMSGDGTPPLVFDAGGSFRTRVGRTGQGPGEFMSAVDAVAIPGDSMLVLDARQSRVTVFSSGLRPARTIRLTRTLRPLLVLTWPNAIVGAGNIAAARQRGQPLHRVSFAESPATVARSFGPDSGGIEPREWGRFAHQLAPAAGAGFWSADGIRYRLTRWSADGEKLHTLERAPDWFSEASQFGIGSPTTPPPPAISAIREDGAGLLWVFVRVAAPTWREGWPTLAPGQREVLARQVALEKMFRTTIEVIDPRSARVVARRTIDDWIVDALPAKRAAAYVVDSDGIPRVRILELGISGR